ncbi:MAG: choice-of-anchor Q domain-containing protein [Chloroflexota bacterium]
MYADRVRNWSLFLILAGSLVLGSVWYPTTTHAATTINVTTTHDELNNDGDCSLREAVRAANLDQAVDNCPAGDGSDIIDVPAGTYNLSDGTLRVTESVQIRGGSADETIIRGDHNASVVSIQNHSLLVCDASNDAVHLFEPYQGDFIRTFVSSGSGGLENAGSARFGWDGDLYVTGFSSGVHRYNGATGAFKELFVAPGSGGLLGPTDLAFGPGGSGAGSPDTNLYITKYQIDGGVLRYKRTNGDFIDAFVGGGSLTPNSIVFGRDKQLYLTDAASDSVKRYNGETGAFVDTFVSPFSGGLETPRGLVFGPDRNLSVASESNDRILRYNKDTGAFMDAFVSTGSGGLDKPTDLTFGPNGNLYVISKGSKSILRYDGATGAFIDEVIASGSGGMGLPSCLLFVTGLGNGPHVQLNDLTITDGGSGGVYVAPKSSLSLRRSVVTDNLSLTGGGIINSGSTYIYDSTISDNDGGARGGGIANTEDAFMKIIRSTVSSNESTGGGGITNSGRLEIINSTVSGNLAWRGGGGVTNTGLLYVASSTITDNEANGYKAGNTDAIGGGIKNTTNGTVYIWNSILADNRNNYTTTSEYHTPDCSGTIRTERYNIIGDGSNCEIEDGFATGTPFDQIGDADDPIDPRLFSLADNGGPTQTHALRSDSPAIDAARKASPGNLFACEEHDQRNAPRPTDGNNNGEAVCDVGAYEYNSTVPIIDPPDNPSPTPAPGPEPGQDDASKIFLPMVTQ